jgi:hypothetical protein
MDHPKCINSLLPLIRKGCFLRRPVQIAGRRCGYNPCMLTLLLQAAKQAACELAQQAPAAAQQAVQQVPPVIHVTVQQPPAGGMPEWAKTLISASVGAFFAIISNVLIEYRHERRIRKQAREQVTAELMSNMDFVTSHWRYLSSSDNETAKDEENEMAARTLLMLMDIHRDRYTYFFEEHKSILYGIDSNKRLSSFYKSIDSLQEFADRQKTQGIMISTKAAHLYGSEFLREEGADYEPKPTIYDRMDELKKKGLWPTSTGADNPTQTET